MRIDEFKSVLQYGAARANLFRVIVTNPIDSSGDSKLTFTCKVASMPGRNRPPLEVFYMGRGVKLAGNQESFEDWSITIINDEDFVVRNALETWKNAINGLENNQRNTGGSEHSLYKSVADIEQLSQTNEILRTYRMIGCFPTVIAPIEMAWDSQTTSDTLVTFSYDYWVPGQGTTGDAGGVA